MTPQEAAHAISLGANRNLLTWEDLQQILHEGVFAQAPMPELEATQDLLGLDKSLPAHIRGRPVTVLENAINEADQDNIPRSILDGRGKELQQVVANALAWGQISVEGERDLKAWAASFS